MLRKFVSLCLCVVHFIHLAQRQTSVTAVLIKCATVYFSVQSSEDSD